MKASLLGTSQIENIVAAGTSRAELENLIDKLAELLAEKFSEVFLVPQQGVYYDLALKYKENGGEKLTAVIPADDEKYGVGHLELDSAEFSKFDDGIELKNWYTLNGEIASLGDFAFVLGYSAGVFSDLSFLKYQRKFLGDETKVIILANTVSQRLPEEFEQDLGSVYYLNSVEEIKQILA